MGRVAYNFDTDTPDQDEIDRRALEQLSLPPAPRTPTQEDVEAQAMGDAYRAMPDADADAIQARSRDTGPGGRVYAAGDIPPPADQRQRMMDRGNARASAATAGQMAALDAPTDRQRPAWMADVSDPRAALTEPEPQHRIEEIPLEELLSGSPPASSAAPQPSTSAGGGKAAPPPTSPPAGRDYTGVDIGDVLRRIPFALGNALSVASGHGAQQFRSEGRELRAQDREDALRAEQQAARDRALAVASGDRQAALDSQRLSREQAAALQREGLDRADARAQAALDQRAELAAQDPRRAAFAREAERQAQLALSDSPATNAIREQVRLQRDLLPPSIRSSLGLTDERLAGMTGEALDRMSSSLPRPSVGIRGSGGTGSAPRTPEGQLRGLGGNVDTEQLIRDAVAAHIPESTARVMAAQRGGVRALASAIATAERGDASREATAAANAAQAQAGTDILPGVHSPMALAAAEAPAIRSGIATAGAQAANLRGLAEIQRQFGGVSARISPEAQARITPRLTTARGMVATLGQTGVITQAEVPTINEALPNPEDLTQMTFGTFNARMTEWQRQLEEHVAAQLAARGVDDAGIQRALATMRSNSWSQGGGAQQAQQQAPAAAPIAPPAQGMVRLRLPSGALRDFPAAQAARAREMGATDP